MKHWPTKPLFEICNPKQWPTISAAELTGTGFPVYGANGQIGYYHSYNHEEPTILITCRGATCGTLNISPPQAYITGNAMALDNPKLEIINLRFLYYALLGRGLDDTITGAAQPQITRANLSRVSIPLPLLAEQERIVKLLDEADELRKLRAQADRRTAALIPALFHEMFGEPLANTKRFPLRRIGELCDVSRGASPRPIAKFMGGTVPWIRIGDGSNSGPYITSTAQFVTEEGAARSVFVPPGSLVVANSGVSCGFARILRTGGCIHDGWLALLDLQPELDAHYLLYFINQITLDLRGRAPSGTQPNLNTALIKALDIPLPPLPLQKEFAMRVAEIRELEGEQATSRSHLNALFQSLLHGAFQGDDLNNMPP